MTAMLKMRSSIDSLDDLIFCFDAPGEVFVVWSGGARYNNP